MRPGRNALCTCGSGKKYKMCCLLKEGNSTNAPRSHKNKEDIIKAQKLMHQTSIKRRRLMLDKKPHIKKYYRIRKMHAEVIAAMARYYNEGKFNQKVDHNAISSVSKDSSCTKLIESSFNMTTRVGEQAFYDIMLYKSAPNMNCITEEFIQNNHYKKSPEKTAFLHSMLASKTGLFEITDTDLDEGYVYIREVFTGKEYTIVDVGLSGENMHADFYLYTRIITYDGISFGSGLNLLFLKTDKFIRKHVRHYKKEYTAEGELARFAELYNYYSQQPDNDRVVANKIK